MCAMASFSSASGFVRPVKSRIQNPIRLANGNGGRPVKCFTLVAIVSSIDENELSATSNRISGCFAAY